MGEAEQMAIENPYIGPRTFTEAQAGVFFGREMEARDLVARVVSERLLIFHAQSGAGKSSLLNTKVIPKLRDEEGFFVLPVGRVSGDPPKDVGPMENLYVFNLIRSMDHGSTAASELARCSLTDFLSRIEGEEVEGPEGEHLLQWVFRPGARVSAPAEPSSGERFLLVIDQFEEIFTSHPERWKEREGFFRQLDEALSRDPSLWVLLAMREDYVGALEPYAPFVSNRFRARFYMQRMGEASALEAVRRPAEQAGVPFAPEVAETLVQNLQKVRLVGQREPVVGQYVEPVQLQVVCYRIWENVSKRPGTEPISLDDLKGQGDVDEALGGFYEDTVAAVVKDSRSGNIGEHRIRRWFDRELLTEQGTRALMRMGPERTGSLPNAVVYLLQERFLLRPEVRSGETWVEVVHDRLVEPIRKNNGVWFDAHLDAWQRKAFLWESHGHPPSMLLMPAELTEVEQSIATHPGQLEDYEKAFLAAGRAALRAHAEHLAGKAIAVHAQDPNLGLLLAREASTIAPNDETRDSLLRLLGNDVHVGQIPLPQAMPGHTDSVNCVAVSPSGRMFATGGADGKVMLWSVAERKPLGEPLLKGEQSVLVLAFDPKGKVLASAGYDCMIDLWDVESQTRIGPRLVGHYSAVWGLAFSPDGGILASSDENGAIVLWDLGVWLGRTSLPSKMLPAPHTVHYLERHKKRVAGLAFRPMGDLMLASASDDGSMGLWDVKSGVFTELSRATWPVLSAAFSADGARLVVGDRHGSVEVWNVATRAREDTFDDHKSDVYAAEFSPDGRYLASGSLDRGDIVVRRATGDRGLVYPRLKGHSAGVCSVAFTHDSEKLISGDIGGTVLVWEVSTGKQEGERIRQNKVSANSLALTPDGNTLVAGCSDGTLVFWDMPSGKLRGAPLLAHDSVVSWVRVSPSGETIACVGWDGRIALWQMAERRGVWQRREHQSRIESVDFSPDGKHVVTCGDDGWIHVLRVSNGEGIGEMRANGKPVLCVAHDHQGARLASAHEDGDVRLWDPVSNEMVAMLKGNGDWLWVLAFHADGQRLATGASSGRIVIWDVAQQKIIHELSMKWAHKKFVPDSRVQQAKTQLFGEASEPATFGSIHAIVSVAFSPDGHWLATAGESGVIALWDVETGKLVGTPFWSESPLVLDMLFTPDGRELITAHGDGTLHRWAIGEEAWRKRARELAGRDLTKGELEAYSA